MNEPMSEEEQLEALKRWWKDNGKWLVAAVVVAVGGYFGWSNYQSQQEAQAAAGSAMYTELLERLGVEEGEAMTDNARSEAGELVEQLKAEHADSAYGLNAALLRARWAVDDDDLDLAHSELRWVLDQEPAEGIEQLARLRLVRVLMAQADYDEALTLLDGAEPSQSLASQYEEARGDLFAKQGTDSSAAEAYERALESLSGQEQNRQMLLQMKLDNVQAASAQAPEAEENAS